MCTNLCRASHLIVEVGSCAIQKQNGNHYLAKLLPRPLSSIRIFEFLSSAKHVLVAGIGGSYDFMSGLPIVFQLIGRRKERLPRQPLLVWQRFRAEQQEGRSPLHSSRFRLDLHISVLSGEVLHGVA